MIKSLKKLGIITITCLISNTANADWIKVAGKLTNPEKCSYRMALNTLDPRSNIVIDTKYLYPSNIAVSKSALDLYPVFLHFKLDNLTFLKLYASGAFSGDQAKEAFNASSEIQGDEDILDGVVLGYVDRLGAFRFMIMPQPLITISAKKGTVRRTIAGNSSIVSSGKMWLEKSCDTSSEIYTILSNQNQSISEIYSMIKTLINSINNTGRQQQTQQSQQQSQQTQQQLPQK